MSTVEELRSTSHPVDLSDLESKRLDSLIAKIRDGAISNVVIQHLEVDGVLRLDPIVDLANAPSEN